MAHPEWDLQKLVYVYLRKALPIGSYVWGVDFPKVSTGMKIGMYLRGVKAGVSDLHVLSNGQYAALELKSLVGRTSDHQEAFGSGIRSAGGSWFVIRTVEGARDALASVGIVCMPHVPVPMMINLNPTKRPKKTPPASDKYFRP